ncbi:methionine--tRNA ligase [Candidatus Uhrbacteria bacterium RIFCSPLOWO2_02_FULL_49_11]|uniref:Methionine--tRNA ligase n=1 Tax=Candidatus Uhrbacteria bacterium RIFCSPLOWO2_02_FULL_49_11 TaxID=1802409 RepID=A0A1F7VCZ1_9BACT|nr:MAG: methionine--tRNA ligase [Candidatus Uhrbacteria bacterium RIFCSPLOWO2_02_FULL_49_11]
MKRFYITTTLPYVNADPHVGFALEIVQADVIARWHAMRGDEVFFNTGTDEHGLKIYRGALAAGLNPKSYADAHAAKYDELKSALHLSYNNFIRTTDSHHVQAAEEFWRRCAERGDIYKKNYQIKYCVGCELEKMESELEDGRCLLHPHLEIEQVDEENYFFRYSRYRDELLEFYAKNPEFVVPKNRMHEMVKFTERGLQDFSISRLKSKMPWGVPVPGDDAQVMYVWFDALVNYVSAIGWPDDFKKFNSFWPGVQTAGKDNLRQQASMWQAMLLSAGLPLSKQILIHGFITSAGQKISKSLGNTISPFDYIEEFGADALRYYLLREIPTLDDGDFTHEKFLARYNADLANGLGNQVQRVTAMVEKYLDGKVTYKFSHACPPYAFPRKQFAREGKYEQEKYCRSLTAGFGRRGLKVKYGGGGTLQARVNAAVQSYQLDQALAAIWAKIAECDKRVDDEKPWVLAKDAGEKEHLRKLLGGLVADLQEIGHALTPFLPQTAESILKVVNAPKIIPPEAPLFPRKAI